MSLATAPSYLPSAAKPSFTPTSTDVAPPPPRWPVGLLGVPFENITQQEAVKRVEVMIDTQRPHYIVTANVDFLVQARSDVELRRILLSADLVLCDGTPLLWASRWLGNPLPERVAGSDVTPQLIAAAAQHGHRLFLLGAQPEVAAEAAARLSQQFPSLIIAGHYSPPFSQLLAMDGEEIAKRLRAAKPDLVLVSFGCPKQEKWIAKNYQHLGVPVMIGVGATLDFMAGKIHRAPTLMQRTGTECIYRLAQEPRRLFSRYAKDFLHFVPAITRQCIHLRRPRRPVQPPAVITTQGTPQHRAVKIVGDLSVAGINQRAAVLAEAMQDSEPCDLDLSAVRFVDSTGAALLVNWHRRLQEKGHHLLIHHPSTEVQQTLQLLQLTTYFNLSDTLEERTDSAKEKPAPHVIPPYPGGHTLAWQGEITTRNAHEVRTQTLHHLLAVGPPPRKTYVIDLTRLRFIDSAGAELMQGLRLWARERDKRLRFLNVQASVQNVLKFAGLPHLLDPRITITSSPHIDNYGSKRTC
jgi:N-acetylglucosaminyldiphosphoundecaprenol N-acetyl-beta-D-mannosaminyltransferase